MARKKVKLALISDETARKATYKKRKKGLIKKVNELTILCGIPACAIISSPFDPKPEVWPDPEGANEMIQRYLNASVLDESKNVNQESFIMQRIAKAREQLKKQRLENREKEMTLSLFQYMEGKDLPDTFEELKELDKLIEKNMKEIENKLATLNSLIEGASSSPSPSPFRILVSTCSCTNPTPHPLFAVAGHEDESEHLAKGKKKNVLLDKGLYPDICCASKKNGTLLVRGLGMPRMKRVGFVGWPLMDVVLTVNFLGMTAH
ncbi:Agamous MADS-box protein AGL36 [Spatholobus suberectus]|nr:Agamous MADS-box protein AGL36 [Spatholobus suberectus]